MSKILFLPFKVITGFLAGKVATITFERVWRLVDDQDSPDPAQRAVKWSKLIAALVLEGAIYRAVRGAFDRGSRELFRRATGSWPGDEDRKRA